MNVGILTSLTPTPKVSELYQVQNIKSSESLDLLTIWTQIYLHKGILNFGLMRILNNAALEDATRGALM